MFQKKLNDNVPKEIEMFIDKSIVVTNIFRTQAYDSIMCGYFCIEFIDFMLKVKTLIEYKIFFHRMILRKMMV